MANKIKQKVESLLGAGATLRESATGAVLKSGRQSILLAKLDGTKTAAGLHYERSSGGSLITENFDLQQTPIRNGNTETIRRSNKRVITRIWDPANGEYRFTKAGDVFYKQLRRNYVIQIPVSIYGSRANGSDYTIKSSLPIEKLGLTKTNSL